MGTSVSSWVEVQAALKEGAVTVEYQRKKAKVGRCTLTLSIPVLKAESAHGTSA
jgi:hypothetical protein